MCGEGGGGEGVLENKERRQPSHKLHISFINTAFDFRGT